MGFIGLFLAVSVQSFLIPNSEASNFLSRKRRANGIMEEALPSNIARECQSEQCDFEEYVEAKENETKKSGINLREVVKNQRQMKEEFEQIYTATNKLKPNRRGNWLIKMDTTCYQDALKFWMQNS